jgi:hypothetical protein
MDQNRKPGADFNVVSSLQQAYAGDDNGITPILQNAFTQLQQFNGLKLMRFEAEKI